MLSRNEMRKIIEGRGHGSRIPVLFSIWMDAAPFGGDKAAFQKWLSDKVCDVKACFLNFPDLLRAPEDYPEYRWGIGNEKDYLGLPYDSWIIIKDWENVQELYDKFPSPEYPRLIPNVPKDEDHYILARSWYTLFERHWSLRGMQNAMVDFYDEPEQVHRLYRHITDFYLRAIERAKNEMGADGYFLSDDLGGQKGPMFSPEIFREFFKPYYAELIQKAHQLDMHVWLHSCGDVTLFMDDLIEIGLDVIHPIQKYAMDAAEIAKKYGGKICILAGFDVQQVIPYGSPQEVREEVRWLIDTFKRDDGRLMLTMGNGATRDWKIDCLDALYEETLTYGKF